MLTMFLCFALSTQAAVPIPPAQFFQEARQAWAVEAGKSWGQSLAGPMLLVDPVTRQVWASEMDGEHQLVDQAGLFTGTLPKSIGIANTAIVWAGKRWSMVLLPLPESSLARRSLIIHESWHRIQPSLGLDVQDLSNGHLDKLEGRYWLQLEWRALAKALEAPKEPSSTWIAAALACRTRRQALFPKAIEAERNLELAEGLAEYTAIRATGTKGLVVEKLLKASGPFARSFAYVSGPAYGLLLDEVTPDWPRRVRRATDLSILLQEAYHLPASTPAEAEAAAAKLGGAELRTLEVAEDQGRQLRLSLATDPLTKGPTLRVPGPFNVQFNPNNTESLDGGAAYHPTATYLGTWGRLEVTGGSLRSADWSEARVTAPVKPEAQPWSGQGWTLELNPGWTMVPTEPSGSFQLVLEKKDK